MNACAEAARYQDAASHLQRRWSRTPSVGIILGTGMGQLANQITKEVVVPYQDIPHFPRATAMGHAGRFVAGRLGQTDVVALDGRFHFYEGYSAAEITLPIAVFKELGIKLLILSNASGGLNPQYRSGDLMVLADHINLMGARTAPLVPQDPLPSRSSGSNPYDGALLERAQEIARRANFACHRGTYIGVLGPNYETRAEYRAMRRLGGDAVGMSTVPEVLAAKRCGLKVFAVSTITNIARPDVRTTTDPQEVIDIAAGAEPKLRQIVLGLLQSEFEVRP